MRVLVHTHNMDIGGSQLNAIELAEAVAARGHEIVVYGPDGELVREVERRGLEFIQAPPRNAVPSPRGSAALVGLVKRRDFDLVHAYEYNSLLDAMYGPGWLLGTPVLSTVLSMEVPFFLPRSVPMLVGTRELVEVESRVRTDVQLLEPPVDTDANRPGVAPVVRMTSGGSRTVREEAGVAPEESLVVLVGRLASELKLEGTLTAIRAMVQVREQIPARLLIVGDGSERGAVERVIAECTGVTGPPAIALGEYLDPRPFYDAADAVIGMGGSILRGLAFAKPAIVQGERGFFEPALPETLPYFSYHGWFGLGHGEADVGRLSSLIIDAVTGDSASRGEWGRRLILDHYSLHGAAAELERVYARVVANRVPAQTRIGRLAVNGSLLAKLRTLRALKRAGLWSESTVLPTGAAGT